MEAAIEAVRRWGTGAGASRLVTGSRPIHTALERALAEWKGTDAAICFPTGFAANLGALSVLGGPDVRVLSDELNHASIIDGCRLSRSQASIYRHHDTEHLSALLGGDSDTPTIVVTDSVFSMDGDAAPMSEIATLCRQHGALLLVDEAHAVLGPQLEPELAQDPDLMLIRMGTLSKTLGSQGGFLAGPHDLIDLMINLARPYIFNTGLTQPMPPPGSLRSASCARTKARRWWRAWPTWWREWMHRAAGVTSTSSPRRSEAPLSPIIPIILGTEERATRASAAGLAEGLWVPCHPSPHGAGRHQPPPGDPLRFSHRRTIG